MPGRAREEEVELIGAVAARRVAAERAARHSAAARLLWSGREGALPASAARGRMDDACVSAADADRSRPKIVKELRVWRAVQAYPRAEEAAIAAREAVMDAWGDRR